jgi:hypothetical protein
VSEITQRSASAADNEIHAPPFNSSTAPPNNATSTHTSGSSNLYDTGDTAVSNTTTSDLNGREYSIRCWNVAGRLASNLSHPAFLESLKNHDINFFQETHLYPSQELSLPLPSGYEVFAVARTPSLTFEKQWGGVVAIV